MKYARIKTYMFVYFYNFQSFGIPVYFGKSTCLSPTYLWLKCLLFQERKPRGAPGAAGTLLCVSVRFTVTQRTRLGILGDQVPRPPPGSVLVVSSVRSAFSPRTSFLSMASLMPKRMRVRTFFRSSYCAHPCAQEGQTRPCRASHLFAVLSCPGRRNENCQGESDLPLDLGCRRVGQLVLSERGKNSFINPSHPHQREKLRDWPGWLSE